MSSMVRKSLGTGFVIRGFGVLMFVLFRFVALRDCFANGRAEETEKNLLKGAYVMTWPFFLDIR